MSIPSSIQGWAAKEKGSILSPIEKKTPALAAEEVVLEVLSCGICHSDLHLIDNDWKTTKYPLVPGHEIIGRIVAKGSSSIPLKEGALVGVGWQRGACLECELCLTARDNMCEKKTRTCVGYWGGYADYHIADWHYCFEMPEKCATPEFAPLLCGGATVYSPLCEFLGTPSLRTPKVGIVGIGGLGHIAVKIAKEMGCEVTAFSSSPGKEKEAKAMGADHFIASTSRQAVASLGPKLDFILVTVNVDLPWEAYLQTLKVDGTLCFVGIPPSPISVSMDYLLDHRRRITASPIGSRLRIAQMLEFCANRGIKADVEIFKIGDINKAIEKVRANKVHYRAVVTR